MEKAATLVEQGFPVRVALAALGMPFGSDEYRAFIADHPGFQRDLEMANAQKAGELFVRAIEWNQQKRDAKVQLQIVGAMNKEFVETTRQEISGVGGEPIRTKQEVDLSQLSTEELERLLPILDKLKPDQG